MSPSFSPINRLLSGAFGQNPGCFTTVYTRGVLLHQLFICDITAAEVFCSVRRCKKGSSSHLQLTVLLLKVFIFIRVAVGKLIYLDSVLLNFFADLQRNRRQRKRFIPKFNNCCKSQVSGLLLQSTLIFFFLTSVGVSVSALARTGTMFTFSCRAFINSTSKGRRLERDKMGMQVKFVTDKENT